MELIFQDYNMFTYTEWKTLPKDNDSPLYYSLRDTIEYTLYKRYHNNVFSCIVPNTPGNSDYIDFQANIGSYTQLLSNYKYLPKNTIATHIVRHDGYMIDRDYPMPSMEEGYKNYLSGRISVLHTGSIEAKVGANRLAQRKGLTITNLGPNKIYRGSTSGVTTTTGIQIWKDQYCHIEIGDVPIYLIAATATCTIGIEEWA